MRILLDKTSRSLRSDRFSETCQISNWLISTLAWGPLLVWVLWPRFDPRLAWQPVVGISGTIALALNWVYSGVCGLIHKRQPIVIAIVVAFNASFVIAAHSSDVGTFTAVSIAGGGIVSGLASSLIVITAVLVSQTENYGALEDMLLLMVPLIQAAMIAGVTCGTFIGSAGQLVVGIAAGLGAGMIVSIFSLAWTYGIVGITAALVEKYSSKRKSIWWRDQ